MQLFDDFELQVQSDELSLYPMQLQEELIEFREWIEMINIDNLNEIEDSYGEDILWQR